MRNVTVTFDDGTSHVYQGVPDNVTPDQITERASGEFTGRSITHLDGGKGSGNLPASGMGGEVFVKAASDAGLPDDHATLNKIVDLVNQGMSPEKAASLISKKRSDNSHSSDEYEAPKNNRGGRVTPEAEMMEKQLKKAKAAGGGDLAKGIGETALTAATGLGSTALGGVLGGGRALYSLASGEGLDEAARKGTETIEKVQHGGTYRPRTASGQLLTNMSGQITEEANKVTAAAGGAVGGALGGDAGRARGEAIGAALPAVAGAAEGLGGAIKSASKEAPLVAMTPKRQAAINAQAEGYTLPPSQARENFANALLEGVSGKVKTAQGGAVKNQEITQSIVKKELGMPDDVPLNHETLKGVREQAGQKYKELQQYDGTFKATKQYNEAIDGLGGVTARLAKKFPDLIESEKLSTLKDSLKVSEMSPGEAIELSKLLREKASDLLSPTASGESKALGRAYREANSALEGMIEKNLESSSEEHLLAGFRSARETIAKTHSIEKAMNAAGSVDANQLAAQMKRGKPMSGGLKKVAEFASHFDKYAKTPEQVGSHLPIDALDTLAAIATGVGTGNIAGAGAILARPAVRAGILSKPYQHTMASAARPIYDKSGRLVQALDASKPALIAPLMKPQEDQAQ